MRAKKKPSQSTCLAFPDREMSRLRPDKKRRDFATSDKGVRGEKTGRGIRQFLADAPPGFLVVICAIVISTRTPTVHFRRGGVEKSPDDRR